MQYLKISIGVYYFTYNSLINYNNLKSQINQYYENIEQLKELYQEVEDKIEGVKE